jgi:hypothetical protein
MPRIGGSYLLDEEFTPEEQGDFIVSTGLVAEKDSLSGLNRYQDHRILNGKTNVNIQQLSNLNPPDYQEIAHIQILKNFYDLGVRQVLKGDAVLYALDTPQEEILYDLQNIEVEGDDFTGTDSELSIGLEVVESWMDEGLRELRKTPGWEK